MSLRKDPLLIKLEQLREELRKEYFIETNEERLICTDQAIFEMVKKRPLKLTDFNAISGLEKEFVEIYGSIFLKEIINFYKLQTKEVKVSKSAHKVLNHYKDRLTNISKTNPNLYMGFIEKIRSFDLVDLDQDTEIVNFLLEPKVKKLEIKSSHIGIERDITTLYRSTNKASKETGSYNLYIAYPYVEGIFKRENFPIKAPLLFFPVKLIRNKRSFTIIKDIDKDIIFNRDLLLVTSKIENNNIDLEMPSINNFNLDVLNNVVIPYYEKNDIKITYDKQKEINFEGFDNELKEVFTKRKYDNFHLKNYLTIGTYKPYSSMIQKDMATILSNNKYNELLEGLIDEGGLYAKDNPKFIIDQNKSIKEESILYINDLNDAQEKVIELLNKEKKLVIWGPPGTGKSQTITSIISSAILKGENVLVVSEKKVALDVIYTRLKGASKYAMFVDDAENKQDFYSKLKAFAEPIPPIRTRNNDLFNLEEEIDEITSKLDKSLELLYGEKQDVKINILYERYLSDKNIIENLTPLKVYQMFNSHFKNINFDDFAKIEKTFDKDKELLEYLEFQKIITKYPLILKLESKISRSGKIELENFNDKYLIYKEQTRKKRLFGNRKIKKNFIQTNTEDLLFLTKNKRLSVQYIKLLLKDVNLHNFLIKNTLKIDKFITKHNNLTLNNLKYLNMLLTNPLLKELEDISKYRKYLFDAYYTGYVENFKAENQKYLYIMDDYMNKMARLNYLISEKMQVTIESFEMELFQHGLNFSNTKRIMDIKRILESPHRPSIKAFIDTYQPELMENIRIWMMTPEVVSAIMPLLYGMFDVVIFDEASQMYVEKGIPSIYRAKKVVIAGDPKQLRPSSLGFGRISDNDEFFEDEQLKDVSLDAKSLLDLARYKYKEALLNYHYRSEYEELIAFSNYAFYEGKLIVSPNQKTSPKPPIEYVYVENGVFDNRENHEEAKAIIEILKKIFRQRKNNESIGIITFNSTQRDLIEKYIDNEIFKQGTYQKKFEQELFRIDDKEDKSLFVKNIENVQGDERDIIIFSMGYGKDSRGVVMRRFGWLNHEGGQNRLNVAITRAKKKIYFVSSLYPEEFKVEDLSSEGPKLLKDFMRYCYYVSNKDHELARVVLNNLHQTEKQTKNVLLSNLAEDVKNRLERSKYNVKTSIGIGKYNINLAIYDNENNSYKVGIICDISDSKDISARKELLHQEKYLKSRGWEIYRIFASNWYTDANKEMRKIREIMKK